MTISTFAPSPGFYNDGTNYAAKGKWNNGNNVRFKDGLPEKIGGWSRSTGPFIGLCRSLTNWQDLSGNHQLGIGTNLKYYVSTNGAMNDITPLQTSSPTALGSNPIATTSGSALITITDASGLAVAGNYVTIAGVTGTIGGVAASAINGNWAITTILTSSTYQITIGTSASSSASGGGASVTAAYEIAVGLADRIAGSGYGGGTYGTGGYGGPSTGTALGPEPRTWSTANFGQDLLINPFGAGIYYWAANTGRAIALSATSGASNCPTLANIILEAPTERQIFAFGTTPIGSSTLDPLYIRWSDVENASQWTPGYITSTYQSQAGGIRLSLGTQIIGAANLSGQILVWTDAALYALTYTGGTYGWGVQIISPNVDMFGPNSFAASGNLVAWMGYNNFYIYNGQVQTIPCTIRNYIYNNINITQAWKVTCGLNIMFNELWFFYPSNAGTENDSYVIWNYVENSWCFGTMPRTAWVDRGIELYPQAASTDGYVYYQENGIDDGSTIPAQAIDAYIESGPIEIQDGDKFVYMQKIVPDITFVNSTVQYPMVTMTVTARDYPGGPYYTPDALPVDKITSVPVEQFTTKLDVRIRGRHFIFRVESSGSVGTWWRLGTQRFDMQVDGRR